MAIGSGAGRWIGKLRRRERPCIIALVAAIFAPTGINSEAGALMLGIRMRMDIAEIELVRRRSEREEACVCSVPLRDITRCLRAEAVQISAASAGLLMPATASRTVMLTLAQSFLIFCPLVGAPDPCVRVFLHLRDRSAVPLCAYRICHMRVSVTRLKGIERPFNVSFTPPGCLNGNNALSGRVQRPGVAHSVAAGPGICDRADIENFR